jgi:AcrR family transcriptional regulator
MNNLGELVESANDVWATPQAAKFLDISRQALNRRVRNRKMLGYPGSGATLFPVWQFDLQARRIHPEVPELLAAFDDDVEPQAIAEWAITRTHGSPRTPAELLLTPDTKADALALASAYVPRPLEEDPRPAGESSDDRAEKKVAKWTPARAGSSRAQHAILLAAADLFARKGPAKVTLREVAAAANVSYGLIYRFYRTKENLLVAVMELLVTYGGERLASEEDAYAAIENSFGADVDAGQFGRMLTWSIIEGTRPDRLIGGVRSRGYRSQIDALWEHPVEPVVRPEFDSNVVASLIALVGSLWDLYEPYLTALSDNPDRSREDARQQITDMLKVLVYATRPDK